jgi:phage baseplate assembly protein gpV
VEQEAEWDDEQIALLIAAQELRADIGSHGVPMSEATSPLADPNDRFHGYSYSTRVKVDWAQRALNEAKANRAALYPDEDADSLLWTVVRDEAQPMPIRKPRP